MYLAFSVPIYNIRFIFENNITWGFVLTSVTLSISVTCVERIGSFRSGRLRVAERSPAKTTKTESSDETMCMVVRGRVRARPSNYSQTFYQYEKYEFFIHTLRLSPWRVTRLFNRHVSRTHVLTYYLFQNPYAAGKQASESRRVKPVRGSAFSFDRIRF